MTIEEVGEYKRELEQIVNRFNKRSELTFSITNNIRKELESLAEKVGASRCIGTGYSLIESSLSSGEDEKCIPALEAEITELILGINNALQTESMLNTCVSAEQSCELARRSCELAKDSSASAKWACIWAAVAAGVSLLGTIATWITIFKK